jgi:hypothetical protein
VPPAKGHITSPGDLSADTRLVYTLLPHGWLTRLAVTEPQAYATLGEPVSDQFMLKATQHVSTHLHKYSEWMLVTTLWATGTMRHKLRHRMQNDKVEYKLVASGWTQSRRCARDLDPSCTSLSAASPS